MPTPRSKLVDVAVTPWYHCISRCVRRAFLCGAGCAHRKQWIEDRLKELVEIFPHESAGFSVMDNHLHLLLRLDNEKSRNWSADDVARRWFNLFPIRDISGEALPVSEERVARSADDAKWVAEIRRRLADLGWFMKCLKEPLARLANKEDGCTGAFWEGRYKSIAVMDEESLLATAAYIDLNPVAAGMAETPEESAHTSLRTRVAHCRANGTAGTLRDDLSTLTRYPAQEAGLWLLPVDDDRSQGASRPGLHEGLTLSCYLRLVDASSRMIRAGKTSIEADLAPIFQRLGLDQRALESTVADLFEPRGWVPNRRRSKPETRTTKLVQPVRTRRRTCLAGAGIAQTIC
jgi:REP element-mobilizing transposase RayT